MLTEVKTYLTAVTGMITLAETGIAQASAACHSSDVSESMRLVVRSFKKEAQDARGYARLPGQSADGRRALLSAASDLDRLRAQARKLIWVPRPRVLPAVFDGPQVPGSPLPLATNFFPMCDN